MWISLPSNSFLDTAALEQHKFIRTYKNSAIEENPLGKVLPVKATKASLDTTEAAGETSAENAPAGEDASEPSGPMAAFKGAAQDGFRADISAISNDETDDLSSDT